MTTKVADFIERVEWEPENGDDAIDEIVATGVDIHIERMNDGMYWMAIYKPGRKDRQIVTFWTKRAKLTARTEHD